jgi:hypothetical protein
MLSFSISSWDSIKISLLCRYTIERGDTGWKQAQRQGDVTDNSMFFHPNSGWSPFDLAKGSFNWWTKKLPRRYFHIQRNKKTLGVIYDLWTNRQKRGSSGTPNWFVVVKLTKKFILRKMIKFKSKNETIVLKIRPQLPGGQGPTESANSVSRSWIHMINVLESWAVYGTFG